MKPIINPSTLTAEQREAIRKEYDFIGERLLLCSDENISWEQGRLTTLYRLFGEELFKGESNE